MKPLLIKEFTATSCIGRGLEQTLDSLIGRRSGLKACEFETVRLDTHVGEVSGVDNQRVAPDLKRFDCRNNRLAELALAQDGFLEAVEETAGRCGAQSRWAWSRVPGRNAIARRG